MSFFQLLCSKELLTNLIMLQVRIVAPGLTAVLSRMEGGEVTMMVCQEVLQLNSPPHLHR